MINIYFGRSAERIFFLVRGMSDCEIHFQCFRQFFCQLNLPSDKSEKWAKKSAAGGSALESNIFFSYSSQLRSCRWYLCKHLQPGLRQHSKFHQPIRSVHRQSRHLFLKECLQMCQLSLCLKEFLSA